jgi:hypothetical protein
MCNIDLETPPPLSARPPVIVSPEMVTSAPVGTLKILNPGVPGAELSVTIRAEAPGPLRMMLVDRSGRALERVIVPVTAGAKSIVSWAGSMLAWSIAARNEPAPSLFVFRTEIVAGTTRPSSGLIAHARPGLRRRAGADPHRDHIADPIQTPIDPERAIGQPSTSNKVQAATTGSGARRGPAPGLDRPDLSGTIRLRARQRSDDAAIPGPSRAPRSRP